MKFYPNMVFHIYNQGNNRRQIFFSDDNYKFFLWKMRAFLLPYGELICYCLMPNHFHWLFLVKETAIPRSEWKKHAAEVEKMRRKWKKGSIERVTASHPLNRVSYESTGDEKLMTLNESIGILQRSYARAINKQQDWSGSFVQG